MKRSEILLRILLAFVAVIVVIASTVPQPILDANELLFAGVVMPIFGGCGFGGIFRQRVRIEQALADLQQPKIKSPPINGGLSLQDAVHFLTWGLLRLCLFYAFSSPYRMQDLDQSDSLTEVPSSRNHQRTHSLSWHSHHSR
jgi:hypothetical protein